MYVLCPAVQEQEVESTPICRYLVKAVIIPSYLDKSSIIVKNSRHELIELKRQHWAQDFSTMIRDVLQLDISKYDKAEGFPVSVIVKFTDFCLDSDKNFNVAVSFSIMNGNQGIEDSWKASYPWTDGKIDTLIGLHDKALGELAGKIAELSNRMNFALPEK